MIHTSAYQSFSPRLAQMEVEWLALKDLSSPRKSFRAGLDEGGVRLNEQKVQYWPANGGTQVAAQVWYACPHYTRDSF